MGPMILKIKTFIKEVGCYTKQFYEIIIGIATLITSIATILLMVNQNKLQEEANIINAATLSPCFHISQARIDYDGNGIKDTEILTVNNIGANLKAPTNIEISVYYKVKKYTPKTDITLTIPIDGYYWAQFPTEQLYGELTSAYLLNNWSKYIDFEQAIHSYSKGGIFYFVSKVDVIKIEYIDTLGISHKSYYQNNSLITEEVYYRIKKDATDTSYDVAKIDADEIIKLLDTI